MRLREDALLELLLVETVDQPAARNPGVLRTESLTVIKRSPIPSLIVDKYEDRSCQIVKLLVSSGLRHALLEGGGEGVRGVR